METQLDKIRQELNFINRTVANGYIDFDTLDELARSASAALRELAEFERNNVAVNLPPSVQRIMILEPRA